MSIFKTSKAKENILRKVREALAKEAISLPYPEEDKQSSNNIFNQITDPLDEAFAETFTKAGGKFIFCNDIGELASQLTSLADSRKWTEVLCSNTPLFAALMEYKLPFLYSYNPHQQNAQACITDCEAAVARTGSFILSSRQNFGRTAPIYYPVHIVVLSKNQILSDVDKALTLIQNKYKGRMPSMINLNTGPSRTADIEKTLVTGIHGPKEVFCFYLNAI